MEGKVAPIWDLIFRTLSLVRILKLHNQFLLPLYLTFYLSKLMESRLVGKVKLSFDVYSLPLDHALRLFIMGIVVIHLFWLLVFGWVGIPTLRIRAQELGLYVLLHL